MAPLIEIIGHRDARVHLETGRAAKALGLTVPPLILARADEVIE